MNKELDTLWELACKLLEDACTTATAKCSGGKLGDVRVETIAILDGVIYIPGNNKFTKFLEKHRDVVVISSLLLSDYLFALQ